MSSALFDFDEISTWGPKLSIELSHQVNGKILERLRSTFPEFVEDASDNLLGLVSDRSYLISHITSWIKQQNVAIYHGSRLARDEIESVRKRGLLLLNGADREARYRKMLLNHPNWQMLLEQLPDIIAKIATVSYAGRREGQVHATLSHSALTLGFNHYLKYGSEFDQHVMKHLLEQEGLELLRLHGNPILVQLVLPGEMAFDAGHRFQIRENETPHLVRTIIDSWAYWLVYPEYTPKKIGKDFEFIFYEEIHPKWIKQVVALQEEQLVA